MGPREEGRGEGEEVAGDTASGRQVSSFSSPATSSALENVNAVKRQDSVGEPRASQASASSGNGSGWGKDQGSRTGAWGGSMGGKHHKRGLYYRQ